MKKNTNNITNENRTFKRKKLKFGLLFTLLTLIIVGVSLMLVFNKPEEKDPSPIKNANYTIASGNNLFKCKLVPNNGKYNDVITDKYAVIYGIDVSNLPGMSSGTTGYNLQFPESISILEGAAYVPYPVKEINCVEDGSGQAYVESTYRASFFNEIPSEAAKIRRIEVPKCVELIEFGSFHGLDNLESVSLPFIGTERGLLSSGTNATTRDGHKSAFCAIFGNGPRLHNLNVSEPESNQFFPPSTLPKYDTGTLEASPSGGNGCTQWYNTDTNVITDLFCPYSLTEVEITDEVIVPTHAFLNMFNLEKVTIKFQEGAKDITNAYSIGDYVFAADTKLKECNLPENASSMGVGTFDRCYKLTTVTLPKILEILPKATFNDCAALQEVTLPYSVKEIGKQAFQGCTSLNIIKTSYQSGGTNNPTSGIVNLPETVETIGESAFRACRSFETVIVPNNVVSIGKMAFNDCNKLSSITLPFIGKERGNADTEEALFGYIFGEYNDAEDVLNNKSICTFQTSNGDPNETDDTKRNYFYIPKTLINVTILNETVIAPGAFMNCSGISSLSIQSGAEDGTLDTVTSISEGALYGCVGLTSLEIPFVGESDETAGQFGYIFGRRAYTGASPVEMYGVTGAYWYVPSGLLTVKLQHQTTLWSWSFYRVNMIENLIVGEATQATERNVFTDMSKLKNLTLPFIGWGRGVIPYEEYWYWSYDRNIRNSLIWLFSYMGKNIVDHYENAWITDWRPYTWDSTIPNSLESVTVTDDTAISTYAFRGFKSLKEIKITTDSTKLAFIQEACMAGCSNLESLDIPYIGEGLNTHRVDSHHYTIGWLFGQSPYTNSYQALQAGARFYIPKNLTRIKIQPGINNISAYAFANMSSLKSVSSDAIIQTLSTAAFANCTKLSVLQLPKANYAKVGDSAFLNCVSLGEMDKFLPTTVVEIGHHALQGTSISHIRNFPELTSVGDYAFADCLSIEAIDFRDTNLNYCGIGLFSGCKRLTDVKLTKYLTPYMFQNCQSLQDINLKGIYNLDATVRPKNIPEGLFDGCISLKSPYIDGGVEKGLQIDNSASGITSIDAYAFRNCQSLETLTLPLSLIQIKSGAFQNCNKLDKIRIPEGCFIMPAGTVIGANTYDDYANGIFYGCNDDFYLEVYHAESRWPSTWGYNWNCYYPVVILGDTTANLFTYIYSPDLKGYLITGLNTADNRFITTYTGSSYVEYLLQDTLTFPSTYNGLFVYGLVPNAFTDYNDELSQVDTFVLGSNFIELGEDSLSIKVSDTDSTLRTITIFSQASIAQAKQRGSFDGEGYTPTSVGGILNTGNDPYKHYYGLNYGLEINYSKCAIVVYKDAWRYVGTVPTILTSALNFEFEEGKYTYNPSGDAIIPVIIDVTPNVDVIKYTNILIETSGTDIIKNIFYEAVYDTSTTPPQFNGYEALIENPAGLSNVNIQYKNNVYVGTASVIFTSNTSKLYGSKTQYFEIIPYELDLFYESDRDYEAFQKYGTTTAHPDGYSAACEVFKDYTSGNPTEDNKKIVIFTDYGHGYKNKVWTQGQTVLNLPEGHSITGTLTTTSDNAGTYVSYKSSIFDSIMIPADGGFKWIGTPRVTKAGVDVTRNFTLMVTLLVIIEPFEIETLEWPGENNGQYEYEYTGEEIVPIPKVSADGIGELDPKFKVTVTPQPAIDPYDINPRTYTAEIVDWDKHNFTFKQTLPKTIVFKIVKGEVKITMVVEHIIQEDEEFYAYDGGFGSWTNTENFYMEVKGLGPNSVMTGTLKTDGWQKGEYTSANGKFGWSTTDPLKITSSKRKTNESDPSSTFLDETDRYNVTLDIKCTIVYQKFDFEFTMTEFEPDGTEVTLPLDDALQVIDKNFTKETMEDVTPLTIEYGADGYQHELGVKIYNIQTASTLDIKFNYNSIPSNNIFTFTNLDTYDINFVMTKNKFEDVNFVIKLNVVPGNYIFDSLTKEYDREKVDPLVCLLRKPIDYDPTDFTFTYYNLATGDELADAPYEIGSYKVIIKTKDNHSAWFNDIPNPGFDGVITFAITPRSLIIKTVDTIDPFDSKIYDGQPWKYVADNASDTALNLLPGDTLTGRFLSRSAEIGTYSSSKSGDFFPGGPWHINNSTLGEQTQNYKLVFDGDYTIKPRQIVYTSQGGNYIYDGSFHTIDIDVTEPTENYTIYYAETRISYNPDSEEDPTEWAIYPFYYIEPGTYTVYFKIVADTYETIYDSETIVIEGQNITYQAFGLEHVYDGFSHSIDVIPTGPGYATVEYAYLEDLSNYVPNGNSSLQWSTIPKHFVKPGTYYYVVRLTAQNYNPTEVQLAMIIRDNGPTLGINIDGVDVPYDRKSHGPIISGLQSGVDISDVLMYYAIVDDSYTQDTATWTPLNVYKFETNPDKYTSDLFTDAGTYNIMVRVQCKGMLIQHIPVTIKINELTLDLDFNYYQGSYDGKYHTVDLTLQSGSTDELIVNGSVEDGTLSYQYKTLVDGVEEIVDLDVYYGVGPSGLTNSNGNIAWTTDVVRHKNVIETYIYMKVEAPNFKTLTAHDNFWIRKADPTITYPIPMEIEYLARAVEDGDFPIETCHDGARVYLFKEYIIDPVTHAETLSNYYIANPINLGKYRAYVSFADTINCIGKSIEFDFTIVPRKLTVEYEKELQYNGDPQIPEVTVTTGTSDTVSYLPQMYDPSNPSVIPDVPSLPGTYHFILNPVYQNDNYVLRIEDAGPLEYKIINRQVSVKYNGEADYTAEKISLKTTYDTANCVEGRDFSVTNLLTGDSVTVTVKTTHFVRGTYHLQAKYHYDSSTGQYVLQNSSTNPTFSFTVEDINVYKTATPSTTPPYYDINLDITLKIVAPELKVTYEKYVEIVFDGLWHGPEITINSIATQFETYEFWYKEKENEKFTSAILVRNVGVYNICFTIYTGNYEPYNGEITIEIVPVTVRAEIADYDEVYNGEKQRTTYTILNNPMELLEVEKPELFYFKKSEIDALGHDIDYVRLFFEAGAPSNNDLYSFYTHRKDYMMDAGEYYAILYFKVDDNVTNNNIDRNVVLKIVNIRQRTLWFKYTGTEPITLCKDYDGQKYGEIHLGNFVYDEDPTSNNNLPDAGLLSGHYIANGNTHLSSYIVRTISADARGNHCNENNGDPYQAEGDFEFQFISITNNGGTYYETNYRPAFTQITYDDGTGPALVYPLQVTIKRIALKMFDVEDAVVEYSGEKVYPRINTQSDGERVIYYYKTDEQFNRIDSNGDGLIDANDKLYNQTDVGYYLAYVHIGLGTNYYAWKYPSNPQPNDYFDPSDNLAYRFARLTVVPKKVEVDWGDLEVVYDGEYHYATPTMVDVFGVRHQITYDIYDRWFNKCTVKSMLNAGTYTVSARADGASGIVNPDNYEFTNGITSFTILKREYDIFEQTKEPWLLDYWSKHYTHADFENFLPGYELDLTVRTNSPSAGVYQYASQFTLDVTVTDLQDRDGDGNQQFSSGINIAQGIEFPVANNFQFNLNMFIVLDSKEIIIETEDVVKEYENQYFEPIINVISHNNGYTINYGWTTLDQNGNYLDPAFDESKVVYTPEVPRFINVGYYKVFYRIDVSGKDGVQNQKYGVTYVTITQRDAYLNVGNLDKVYDGLGVTISSVSIDGGFNGTRDDLVYEYKPLGAPDSAYTTTSPVNVGEYLLRISSTADGNSSVPQNYTPLNSIVNEFNFKITPAILTFVVNDDMEVTSDNNITYNETGNLVNNQTGTLPEFYVNGLCGSDGFKYKVMSATGMTLERKNYLYSDAISSGATNYFFYDGNLFYFEWSTYDQNNTTNETSNNYHIKLVFSLVIHFPYMNVVVNDRTVDYNSNPYYILDQITVNVPYPSACAFSFGEAYGTYDHLNNMSYTKPGTYVVYIKISASGYEDYYDQAKLVIKHKSRLDNLNIGGLDKTYDATAYDGTNHGVPDITWNDPSIVAGGEALPAKSLWTVEYFTADNNNPAKEWRKSSEAMTSVINAGEYIYRVVIPALDNGLYGETVIEKHFRIGVKEYTITGTATKQYDGSLWTFDLGFDLNNNPTTTTYTVNGLLTQDADGHPVNHKISKATLISSGEIVGTYSGTGANRTYISDTHEYSVIENNDPDKDVTINYKEIVDVTLEIIKGDMIFSTNIPADGFDYTGKTITPIVTVDLPAYANDNLEYSEDGVHWQKEPFSKILCGTYTFYARCSDPKKNYNDLQKTYTYQIKKKQNKLTIDPIDKEYNGNQASLPVIHTYDYDGVASASMVQYLDHNGVALSTAPTNVGDYFVRVLYDDTNNYTGIQEQIPFKITPCKLTLQNDSAVLTYNAQQQCPTFEFVSHAYPTWEIMSIIFESVDYSIHYYNQSDTSHSSPLAAKPKDVGDYTMVFTLLGTGTSSASNNFDFDNDTDEISLNYSIVKANVTISYTGVKNYNAGQPLTITLTELNVVGLPQGVNLTSYIETKTGNVGTYTVNGSYTSTNFTNNFKWNPDQADPIFTLSGANNESISNYNVTLDLSVTIRTGQLPYSVAKYDGVYDGEFHTLRFEITQDPSDTVTIMYSTDGGSTFDVEKPKYKDFTNGPVHVIVKVVSNIYGTVILGNDPQASDYNEFTINITRADLTVDASRVDLSKVYDDQCVENPQVPYTHFGTDDLSGSLTYTYYQQDYQGIGGTQYSEVNRIDVKNVGSYYVVIKMEQSTNYNSYTCDPVYFDITPRSIVLNLKDQTKVYDALPWSTKVSTDPLEANVNSAATITGLQGVAESGLVTGHMFTGIIKTVMANAGTYSLPSEFAWENSYRIYKGPADDINIENYNLILNLEVMITNADFDITLSDGIGVYDGVTEYFIKHTWNTYPYIDLPSGLTQSQMLAAYDALIEYSTDGFNGPWSSTPIGKMYGTTTIYVKVSADNYNTFNGTAQIIVTPLSSGVNIVDLGVLAQDKVYNGQPYEDNTIVVTSSIPNDTRTVQFKYYLRNDDGTIGSVLQNPPIDAGKYMLVMKLDADVANGLSAFESDPVSFNVVPAKIPVVWYADIVTERNIAGQMVKEYTMNYTGSNVVPSAKASGVVNIGTTSQPAYEDIPLEVIVNGGGTAIEIGQYQAKASIIVNLTDKYYNNYELIDPIKAYNIGRQIPTPPGPGPTPTPDPDPDHQITGIEFRVDQYDPLSTVANTPFVYGDEIVIEVTFHYGNPQNDKTYIYHMDETQNWKIVEIRDNTDQTIIDNNPSEIFHFEFPDPLTTPTFKVKAILDDKTHSAWNTNGDTADREITVHMDPKPLDPSDPTNPEIWLQTPSTQSLVYDGTQRKFDQTKTDEQIKVWHNVNHTPDKSDDVEIDPSNYTVYYGNNINVTTSDNNQNNNAYFIVKSNTGYTYTFSFGDYDAYQTAISQNQGTADYIYKTVREDIAANAAFRFEIFSPQPDVITLKENPSAKFVSYDQDFTGDYELTYTYGVSNSDRKTGLASITNVADRRSSIYKLSHIPMRKNVKYVTDELVNPITCLAFYKEDGTLIWDGADGTPAPNGTNPTDWIGSGVYIVLYDKEDKLTRKAIDSVEIVVVGDINGDGNVTVADSNIVSRNVFEGFDVNNISKFKTARYLAGLMSDKSIQRVASSNIISKHIFNFNRDQSDYIEEKFYSQYINSGSNSGSSSGSSSG